MKIAVYGTARGGFSSRAAQAARTLGKLIGERGHTLITGACGGVPLEAVKGAFGERGIVIGYSPAGNIEEHRAWGLPETWHTDFVFVPETYEHVGDPLICRKYRNIASVAACDAAIFVAGKMGTLNEFTIAYDLGKPIGVLTGSGGTTDLLEDIVQVVRKKPRPFMVFSKDPAELLNSVEKWTDTWTLQSPERRGTLDSR